MPMEIVTLSPQGEGYTLGQMVQLVRQALRTRRDDFASPVTGPQGLSVAQLIAQVRNGLRDDAPSDSDRFIKDADIVTWLNEGIVQLGDRTRSVRGRTGGTVGPSSFGTFASIVMPPGFTALEALYITGVPVQKVDDDEEWNDWVNSDQAPPRRLCRLAENMIEIFPAPDDLTTYELDYVARPYQFTSTGDANLTNLPEQLHPRVINYARGNAYWKMRDFDQGDRAMSLFERGLGPGGFERPTEPDKGKPREVQDHEIIAWLNAGCRQIAFREELVIREATDQLLGGYFVLPADFIRSKLFRLVGAAGEDGTTEVEHVNEDVFQSWAHDGGGASPPHYLYRIMPPNLQTYPAVSSTAVLQYVAFPNQMSRLSDQPEIPFGLQEKVIDYARAEALLSAPLDQLDLTRAGAYRQTYERGLASPGAGGDTGGPLQMVPEPNAFDLDPGAMHR